MREKIVSFLSLFSSSATLLCCALPAALSIIAGGTAVGALLSSFPWLIPLSRHKEWIFIIAGIMLVFNGLILFKPKGNIACAVTGGKDCAIADRFSKWIFWFSLTLYAIGAFSAYALVPILRMLPSCCLGNR